MEFEVSIFIYSYLCDQRDHQRDLTTRLSRYPPEKSDSEKKASSVPQSRVLSISFVENQAKGRIISACLLTIVSGAITSQVLQKKCASQFFVDADCCKFSTQIVSQDFVTL